MMARKGEREGRAEAPSFYFLFQAPPTGGSISTHSSLKFTDKALCRSIKSARIRKKEEKGKKEGKKGKREKEEEENPASRYISNYRNPSSPLLE